MEVSLFCHPNDIALALDMSELRQRGLSRLVVNVLYHDWTCWSPLSVVHPIRRERGGKSAVALGVDYPAGLAPHVGDPTALGHLLARANDAGLVNDAWTVGLHRDDLMSKGDKGRRAALAIDSFGTSQWSWLCPSAAASLAYLEAHMRDLARAGGFARVVLEGCHYPLLSHGNAHERDLSRLPAALTELLELCFCPSCRAAYADAGLHDDWRQAICAEVRGDAWAETMLGRTIAARLRRTRVLTMLAAMRSTAPALQTAFADQPAIGGHAFRTGQRGQRTLASIHAAAGIDVAAIAEGGTRMVALAYFRTPADVVTHVEAYLQAGVAPSALSVVLRAASPDSDNLGDLREKLRLIGKLGITDVGFYELTQLEVSEWALTRDAIEAAAAA